MSDGIIDPIRETLTVKMVPAKKLEAAERRIAELQARLDAHEAATNAVEKVDLVGVKETRLAVARIVSLLTWNPDRNITQDEIRWALTVNENDSLYKTIKAELDEIRGKVGQKQCQYCHYPIVNGACPCSGKVETE